VSYYCVFDPDSRFMVDTRQRPQFLVEDDGHLRLRPRKRTLFPTLAAANSAIRRLCRASNISSPTGTCYPDEFRIERKKEASP